MTTVTINVHDANSVKNAINQIQEYKNWLKRKTNELMRRLAELGAETARNHYASGFIDENEDVVVTIEPTQGGYLITAAGEDVYFLEFGSGVAAGNGYDTSVIEPPVDITPGSWSRTHGTGEFERYGSWHHDGKKYTMTVPRMGMYFGVKEIQMQVPNIATEVFNS